MSGIEEADGYTIFCEDIRHEVSGQVTYVGVYTGAVTVPQFPFTLPKLAMAVHYRQPLDAPRENVRVFVYFGEDETEPVVEAFLNISEAPPLPAAPPLGDAKLIAATNVVFSPFVVEQMTVLKVRAMVGSHRVKLGTVMVIAANESTAA